MLPIRVGRYLPRGARSCAVDQNRHRVDSEDEAFVVRFEVRFPLELDAAGNTQTLAGELARAVAELKPERLVMTEAGEWRVQEAMVSAARAAGRPLEVRPDRHFFQTRAEFAAHAEGR